MAFHLTVGGKWSWIDGGMENFQLDIVGFLAVLGEGAVLATSQVSSLTWLCYVPRILPAPQALLPPNRPNKLELPTTRAWVTAVFNGNSNDHLDYFTQLCIVRGRDLCPFEVRCVRIEYSTEKDPTKPRSSVTARVLGPVLWVTVLGFSFSVVLLVLSAVYRDGMSFSATVCLSLLSTITGVANGCELKLFKLPKRENDTVPAGDAVIRYPNGSFIVVKCEEKVARELFFEPMGFKYQVNQMHYRLISFLGTVLLMLGIVFLANATLPLQMGWALSYGLINAVYWVVAALAPHRHWDFSTYTLREIGLGSGPESKSFTIALWKAIVLTRSVDWVRHTDAAPRSPAWEKWIHWADARVHKIAPACHRGRLRNPIYDPTPTDGNGKGTASDALIWNDDLDGVKPLQELICLLQKTKPALDADRMTPPPQCV